MSLSSAKVVLENKNADLVRCEAQIGKLIELYKLEKVMRLESFSSIGNEYRGEVQRMVNKIGDMLQALEEQVVVNMVEILIQEVVGDPNANLDPNSKVAVHLHYPPVWMMDGSTCGLCCEGFTP